MVKSVLGFYRIRIWRWPCGQFEGLRANCTLTFKCQVLKLHHETFICLSPLCSPLFKHKCFWERQNIAAVFLYFSKNWFVNMPLIITIRSSSWSQTSFIKCWLCCRHAISGSEMVNRQRLKHNFKIIHSSYRWSNYTLLIKILQINCFSLINIYIFPVV